VLDFGALPYATHARLTVPVTILKGKNPRPCRHITLSELLSEIETIHVGKLNHAQSLVCAYEQYLQNVEKGIEKPKKAYETLKDELYGFQLGKFSYRSDERANCLEYVPCLVFDIDGCASTYDVFLYQQKLKALDSVFACFASPSGYGLRILIWTNSTYETHQKIYLQILEFLCQYLDLTTDKRKGTHLDTTCKNESRHFYYVAVASKAFYLNLESKIWESRVETPAVPEKIVPPLEKKGSPQSDNTSTSIDVLNDEVKIEYILKMIDMKKPRKLQCFDFGCLCCENRVDFYVAQKAAERVFWDSGQTKPLEVISAQLKDGYAQTQPRYTDEQFAALLFKKFNVKFSASRADRPMEKTKEGKGIEISSILEKKDFTKAFFDRLPSLLKQCTTVLPDDIEKKVFFFGALGVLSSLMPHVQGVFREETLSPHLFIYVVATGGAGKGALRYAQQLILGVANQIREETDENKQKQLLIPANITTSLLLQLLQDNQGNGLLFETEGGLLAQLFKMEHSNYSLQLRQAFHHEWIGLARQGNGKSGKINFFLEKPRIAVVFSGTFDQLTPLVKNGEDGLLSRFALLTIQGNYEWKDANPKTRQSPQILAILNETARQVQKYYSILRDKEISFEFTDEQWIQFDDFFRERKPKVVAEIQEKRGAVQAEICNGIINRLGVIGFRTAMLLTVLRALDTGKLTKDAFLDGFKPEILICEDIDFQTALEFVEIAQGTALEVLDNLHKKESNSESIKKVPKKAQNEELVKKAIELKAKGYSYSEIAKILLGDESKKSIIYRWTNDKAL
jgi:hypothetical protein